MQRLVLFLCISFLAACGTNLPSYQQTPFISQQINAQPTVNQGQLKQRILLLGDAGHSTLEPLQASLLKAQIRASEFADKTSIIMLGDNIYYFGFPDKEQGQTEYSESQLEDISHLEAQLSIAKNSGAEIFIVPGNHDWYASQVDSQAAYVKQYALDNNTRAVFTPHQLNKAPLPEVIHRNGVSLFFIDSMWMIKADEAQYQLAMVAFNDLLKQTTKDYPDNLLLVTAHHPIETMGPHNKYYTSLIYKTFIGALSLLTENDQDTDHPNYRRLIDGIELTLARYPKAIYAAGHEHSLQIFKDSNDRSPQYRLVSGAANSSKITGVGSNDNSLFALAQEGFMELDILDNGIVLRVFSINHQQPVLEIPLFGKP